MRGVVEPEAVLLDVISGIRNIRTGIWTVDEVLMEINMRLKTNSR